MKKGIKKALIGGSILAGAAAVAAGISALITKTLVDEALDREEPKIMIKAKERISGGEIDSEILNNANECSEKLKSIEMQTVEIESFDGTKLIGHLYPADNAKRIIVAMHGWRSNWWRDFAVIYDFWHDSGCTVLFAEQRGQGESEGDHMGFGMIERYDCIEWVKWLCENDQDKLPIYLAGVSMGAATVLMASGLELPDNVHGIMADCGFTTASAVWKHVAEDNLHLSFDIRKRLVDVLCKKRINIGSDEYSTVDAMRENTVPVLFIHGTADTFVPVSMTYENYEACKAEKRLLIVEGAEHGLSYIVDKDAYQKAVLEFFKDFD